MAQFDKNSWFNFNGYDSTNKYMICTKDGDSTFAFGTTRAINEEEGVLDVPIFYGMNNTCPEFTMSISKVDSHNNIQPMLKSDLQELSKLLFKNEYLPLVIDGLTYYVIFTKGSLWQVNKGEGLLTLTMRCSTPYAFGAKNIQTLSIATTKTITINNASTYENYTYPDIEITCKGSTTAVTITNNTTGDTMSFTGLNSSEHIYVYGDAVFQMVSRVDSKRNIFAKSNKRFLRLAQGNNTIVIRATNAEIKIIQEPKITIY